MNMFVLSRPYNLAIAENAHFAVINMKTCLIEKHSQGLNISGRVIHYSQCIYLVINILVMLIFVMLGVQKQPQIALYAMDQC
jgi:hypothetical protein